MKSRKSLPFNPDGSSYKCSCGADGFCDVGEGHENRYPCFRHYLEFRNRPAWLYEEPQKQKDLPGG